MLYAVMVLLTFIFAGQSLFGRLYSEAYAGKGNASAVFSILYGIVVGVITLGINGFVFTPSVPTLSSPSRSASPHSPSACPGCS